MGEKICWKRNSECYFYRKVREKKGEMTIIIPFLWRFFFQSCCTNLKREREKRGILDSGAFGTWSKSVSNRNGNLGQRAEAKSGIITCQKSDRRRIAGADCEQMSTTRQQTLRIQGIQGQYCCQEECEKWTSSSPRLPPELQKEVGRVSRPAAQSVLISECPHAR